MMIRNNVTEDKSFYTFNIEKPLTGFVGGFVGGFDGGFEGGCVGNLVGAGGGGVGLDPPQEPNVTVALDPKFPPSATTLLPKVTLKLPEP